jgi:hypothetical protein
MVETNSNYNFLPVIAWVMFFQLLSMVVVCQPFVHPGILHGTAGLSQMKDAVMNKNGLRYAGYGKFIQDPASQFTYKMQGPMDTVGRNPTVGQAIYDNDANAAHQNAVMWAITGDRRYAEKSIEIINAWTLRLKSITGRDAVLMAGLGPFIMLNAAEIIRYTNAGWAEADVLMAEKHFETVVYPVIKNYAPFANGNWDAAAIKTCMAIGVFCNSRPIFEDAVRYYTSGWGNGCITNYIINNQGQIQESGRDQPHSQLGIGMLAECCAIAWNQGLDLYGYKDDLLLKGFEYTAKYNLGNDDMPFQEWLDRTGKYHHFKISDKGRGQLRPLYNQVYQHYVLLQGIAAPYVSEAAKKISPEGPGRPGADHPGYGTLYFSASNPPAQKEQIAQPITLPAAPAGLVASGFTNGIHLSWIGLAQQAAVTYTVKRSDKPNGTFTVIANKITDSHYTDSVVDKSKKYFYTIAAENSLGAGEPSYAQAAVAGLPNGWSQFDIGISEKGNTLFNGTQFSIEAYGKGIGSTADSFHFTAFEAGKSNSITIRLQPQPSSQFSTMGLMLRADTSASAPFVALTVYPGKTGQVEAPDWHTRFEQREAIGTGTKVLSVGGGLKPPAVTYGRLTGSYWLKLIAKGATISGYGSYDGYNWQKLGTTKWTPGRKKSWMGIAASSGMANSTNVRADILPASSKTN